MNRNLRMLLWAVSLAQILFALGFIVQVPVVTRIWPILDTTPLSYTFIGSIFAAAAASTIWCLYAREDAALAGIALDYVTILAPLAVLMVQLGGGSGAFNLFALVCAITVVVGAALLRMTWRIPARDKRPTPRLVTFSFGIFVVALIIVGGALVLKTPGVLPWTFTLETGVAFGWMFIGAAAYFAYGLWRQGWYNAGGQLAGFLAYDLVLISPFLQRLPTIAPELRNGLIIYLVVVTYSGILAAYYLFVNPTTRVIPSRTA